LDPYFSTCQLYGHGYTSLIIVDRVNLEVLPTFADPVRQSRSRDH
jgi:hypothetical protein